MKRTQILWEKLFLLSGCVCVCDPHLPWHPPQCPHWGLPSFLPSSSYRRSWHQRGAGQQIVMASGTFGLFLHFQPSLHAGTCCADCISFPQLKCVSLCICDSTKCVFFNTGMQLHVVPCWSPHIRSILPWAASCGASAYAWDTLSDVLCITGCSYDCVGITLCVPYDLI